MPSIIVDDGGTELSYYDSGIPQGVADGKPYPTIFALHGMVFCAPVFARLMKSSASSGIRFVAINRRDYPGSTPLTAEDTRVLQSGTDAEKASFLRARGVEIATFIDRFIEQYSLPSFSPERKDGGVILLGWSLGCTYLLSVLANLDVLPTERRRRLSTYLRAYVMFEPPTVAIGSPRPPGLWSPVIDTSLPEEQRIPAFVPWITAYFKHGDLSTHDPDVISYYVPAFFRPPSVYEMSEEEAKDIVYISAGGADMLFMFFCEPAIQENYKKACFDANNRALYPNLKMSVLCGDVTSPHGIPSFWSMQDDNKANGGGLLDFKTVQGANHVHFWDEPEYMLKTFLEFV